MASIDYNVADNGYGNAYLDSLIYGARWTGGTVTYAFGHTWGQTWSNTEMLAFDRAFDLFEEITNLTFHNPQTTFGTNLIQFEVPGSTWQPMPDGSTVLADHELPGGIDNTTHGRYNVDHSSWSQLQEGGLGFQTIIHELGHALGLEHPHDGEELFPGVTRGTTGDLGTNNLNQHIWTMMSYNPGWTGQPGTTEASGHVATPMAFDIAALQKLYGANMNTRTGADTYYLPGANVVGTFWSCIWDAGGKDTISNENSNLDSTIDLRAAPLTGANAAGYVSWVAGVAGGFTIANKVVIEKAIGGGGMDTITGNGSANSIDGRGGDDVIRAGGGNDTVIGGATDNDWIWGELGSDTVDAGFGNDRIYGDFDADEVKGSADNLKGGGGQDRLEGGGGDDVLYGDFDGANRDNVVTGSDTDTLWGGEGSDSLHGGGGADILHGGLGFDHLNGGQGVDTMTGGADSDTYVVDALGDTVTEVAGGGAFDMIEVTFNNYTLVANVEALLLRDGVVSGNGNGEANTVYGNGLANQLKGGAQVDTLEGMGGQDMLYGNDDAWADILVGGADNDVYFVGAGDIVNEAQAAFGTADQVNSSVNFTLGAFVENLTLSGDAAVGTGNSLKNILQGTDKANSLYGGDEADTLYGMGGVDTLHGGAGGDDLRGGKGSDTYFVDNSGDTITEAAELNSKDVLFTSAHTYALALGREIEEIRLLSGAVNLNGNELNDRIFGNAAANTIKGQFGDDTILGGGGKDVLWGVNGIDTVDYSDKTWGVKLTLKESTGVTVTVGGVAEDTISGFENVIGGSGQDQITGDSERNNIQGGAGDDTLSGGTAFDTLDGGAGIDTVDYSKETGIVTATLTGSTFAVIRVGNNGGIAVDQVRNIERVLGGSWHDKLTGDAGDNTLFGNAGTDVLKGGDGNDLLRGGLDSDTLDGGNGYHDAADYSDLKFRIEVALLNGTNSATVWRYEGTTKKAEDSVRNIENVIGTAYDDRITGNDGANHLVGGAGKDGLYGGKGDDTLNLGAGEDFADGGESTGSYSYTGPDGKLVTYTYEHTDIADYSKMGVGITVTLRNQETVDVKVGTDEIDRIDNMEGVNGGHAADRLTGDSADNYFVGNGGNDILTGGAGNDHLYGGANNDTMFGGAGTDHMNGEAGTDTVDFSAETLKITLSLHDYDDYYTGAPSGSAVIGATDLNPHSGTRDWLIGIENAKTGGGADTLFGSAVANTLEGGAGNDTFHGKAGNDRLVAGTGADTFVFGGTAMSSYGTVLSVAQIGRDTIVGFEADDEIHLDRRTFTAFEFNTPGAINPAKFSFGASMASNMGADDHLFYNTNDGLLYYDRDTKAGNTHSAVAFAVIDPKFGLTASDFELV